MRILIYLASIMVFTFGCTKESQKSEAVTNPKLDSAVSEAVIYPNSDSSATEVKVLITRPDLDTAKVDLDSISFIGSWLNVMGIQKLANFMNGSI